MRDGADILKALGIPIERCTGADIRFRAARPVEVTAYYFTGEIKDDELVTVAKRYRLVEIEEDHADA